MQPRFLLFLAALSGLPAVVAGQQTAGSPPSSAASTPGGPPPGPAALTSLPPAPTAPVGSGDSAARSSRAKLYAARGEAAVAAGMRDTARVAFEKALYEDAACTDASVGLATILTEDGDGLHARSLIMRALQRDPTNPKLQHFSARKRGAPADTTAP